MFLVTFNLLLYDLMRAKKSGGYRGKTGGRKIRSTRSFRPKREGWNLMSIFTLKFFILNFVNALFFSRYCTFKQSLSCLHFSCVL